MYRLRLLVFLVTLLALGHQADGFLFTPHDFYGANYSSRAIVHYSSAGTVLESITVPSSLAVQVKGLAFGPDGLLYAVAGRDRSCAVLALDAAGIVHQTYPYASNLTAGNISYGKIAFDTSGNFYVGGGGGLVRFTLGAPNSGTLIHNVTTCDVEALPSGNLLALENYALYELTNTGGVVRQISPIGVYFTDNRGVEYDPAANSIYVSMLGHTGAWQQTMKFDGATGQLLAAASFTYGDDIFLADDGRLIVGSRTQSPGIFTKDLAQIGSFGGTNRMFVTQLAIPEPVTLTMLALGMVVAGRRRR